MRENEFWKTRLYIIHLYSCAITPPPPETCENAITNQKKVICYIYPATSLAMVKQEGIFPFTLHGYQSSFAFMTVIFLS